MGLSYWAGGVIGRSGLKEPEGRPPPPGLDHQENSRRQWRRDKVLGESEGEGTCEESAGTVDAGDPGGRVPETQDTGQEGREA